jgi:ABC-type branched-subunit amino acid transport system ATPase component
MKETDPMLEVINLNKSFGGIMALTDVSFQVDRGTITALIGPNGAGKTTLLNIISGICFASAGKILFEGSNISGIRPHQVTYLGITRTFQNLQVFQNMTVIENVMVGFHSRTSSEFVACLARTLRVKREEKEVREKAAKMLHFVNLAGREDQPGSSLPCGDQKRLELARALVSRPRMVLLDEPVSGLNTSETEEMADLILKLKESGITVLLVEHDMNLVMQVSDMIVVLNHGEKLAQGRPAEIQNDDRVIAAYLGDY